MIAAANILLGISTVVAREVPAQDTAVMTVGQIVSGTKGNIIPDRARCGGPARLRGAGARAAQERLGAYAERSPAPTGRGARQVGGRIVPGLRQPRGRNGLRPPCAASVLGEAVVEDGERAMPSDDMGLFLRARPGCYFRVGIQPTDGRPHPHHAPEFELNEDGLVAGLRVALTVMRRALAPRPV